MNNKPLALALAVTWSAAPLVATAQQTAPATMLPELRVSEQASDDYAPATSTVGAKTPTALRDIPQSITVVNRAVLDAQGAASLSDALRNVPGITLGAAEGGQIGNNINLRGFSARTDIYLDGMRDRGQYYRDVFDLESVEVLKGPSSMLFGRGSTGGVINQVSKQPTLREQSEVSATIGTNESLRTTADLNHPLSDTSAFRLNLMAQDVGTTRDVMKNQDFGVAPSLRLGIGTPTEITLSALIQHNRDMPDYGFMTVNGRPTDVRRDNYYGLTDSRVVQDVSTVSARVEHKLSPTTMLRNQTQLSRYEIDSRVVAPNAIGLLKGGTFTALNTATGNATSLPLSALTLRYASRDRDLTDESAFNQTDVISKFDTGAFRHTLIAGMELGHETYSNQAYTRNNLPIVPVLAPLYIDTPSASVSMVGNLAQTSATTVAAYANDTLELTKQWKLVGGLRWDRYRAGISNSINSANTAGNTTLPSASQTVNFTSVRAGAIYQPSDTRSYYASYGTSFNPSLEQLTVTTGQQDLDPEKSRSIEVGAKWDLMDGNLSLTSALFQIEKTNARTQVATGVYQLAGDIRVNGFELGVAGRITPKWQVFGGYTWLDAEILQAAAFEKTQGKVPANTPKTSATLWTSYKLTPAWETGGGVSYLSNRYANNTNAAQIGSYLRWDAMLAYHQPKYELRLNLLNLADRRDYVAAITSDGGRAVPEIGRTALLTATYKF